jgi:hypothetical protein
MPGMVVHGLGEIGPALRYGPLTVAVTPLRSYPSHYLSIFPLHLDQVRRMDIIERAAFTAASLRRDAAGAIDAMRTIAAQYRSRFVPEDLRTLVTMIEGIEAFVAAGESAALVIRAAAEIADFLGDRLAGRVPAQELAILLDQVAIEPGGSPEAFRPRSHIERLLGAGFDQYVYLHVSPPKWGIGEFLRRGVFYRRQNRAGTDLPILESLVFPIKLRNPAGVVQEGHLVFAPCCFRVLMAIRSLAQVGRSRSDTTRGSDYAPVLAAETFTPELRGVLARAHADAELSFRLVPTTVPPPGYYRREALHHLCALELHLARVWPVEGAGALHRIRWNLDLLYRAVYGVRWKAGRGKPDPHEVALHLDALSYRLGLVKTDHQAFADGAIERVGELRSFLGRLPAHRQLAGFAGLFA